MDTLQADLQDIIFNEIDSKTLYDIIQKKPSKIISQVLEKRNQTILKKLIDEVFALTSITIDNKLPSRIPAGFTDHITILYSVIHLPNMHPLAKESIEHLMARYPTPENSISIKNNAINIISQWFDYVYDDYTFYGLNNWDDNEKYWDMFLDEFFKKSGIITNFIQQFYLFCNIIIEFYQNDYKENENNFYHKINLRGFYIDLKGCLKSLIYCKLFTNLDVLYMIDILQT
jgi:hypothetical protein